MSKVGQGRRGRERNEEGLKLPVQVKAGTQVLAVVTGQDAVLSDIPRDSKTLGKRVRGCEVKTIFMTILRHYLLSSLCEFALVVPKQWWVKSC